jgi:peptidoglycan/LPS O-acetylase OafA/YrhL/lysophospholipase L1-like esterase
VTDGLHGLETTIGEPDPDAPRQGTNLSYIPALDGIRGVAIIVIMGFHGGVFLTSGGFYSLDMFFTLSGFLITSLLISEWQRTGTIRLGTFWARRARRLLPALLVMVTGVAVMAAILVPPDTYTHLRSDGISALFYFANWHFIAINSNYFVQTGLASPLTHTWSLAVEEQFYLVWPLIVLGVFKVWRSTRVLLVVCLVGAAASALDMGLLYSSSNVDRVYYGTDTRAQSLLIGAALAVALSMWADRRRRSGAEVDDHHRVHRRLGGDPGWAARTDRGRRAVLAVGLAGVAGSVVLWTTITYNDPLAFRGGFFVAALATAAVLFSVVCSQRSVLAAALSFSPLRYVGRISYGLYLWHYPLFLYIDHARTGLTGYALFAVRVAATLVIATASFYLVERPIRQRSFLKGWTVWVATPVAAVAVVVALFAATTTPSLAAGPTPPVGPGRSGQDAGAPVRVLLVGDSTALTLGIGLSEHQQAYDVNLLDGGILGCGITDGAQFQLQGVDAPMATQCGVGPPTTLWPRIWLRDIARQKPDVVMILAGRWEVANRTYRGRWTNIDDPGYKAYVKRQLQYAVRVAGSGGAHVVLMTAPCYDSGEQPNGDPWPEDSRSRLAIYNGLVREVAATSPDTSVLNFNAMACPGGQYEEYVDGIQVRQSDGVHFTFDGGDVFASRIWPAMVALGRQQMAGADGR